LIFDKVTDNNKLAPFLWPLADGVVMQTRLAINRTCFLTPPMNV